MRTPAPEHSSESFLSPSPAFSPSLFPPIAWTEPRAWALLLGLTLIYVLAGKFGLSLAFLNVSASPVWPPTGIALAALLLLGRHMWPAIFIGAFLVNVTTTGAIFSSIGIAFGNTLEAVIGATLVERYAEGRHAFDRPDTALAFTGLAGLSTTISATIGTACLVLFGQAKFSGADMLWLTWWLGDFGGAVIGAPLLLVWATNPTIHWRHWRPARVLELATLLFGLWFVSHMVFGGWPPMRGLPVMYLCVPWLVWAAYRFGPRETATAICLMSGLAVLGTMHGFGPFARPDENAALLLLQGFLVVLGPTILALAAGVATDRESQRALRRAHDELEERVQARTHELAGANDALVHAREKLEQRVVDRTHQLEQANAQLREKIDQLEQFEEAVVGRELKMIALEKELEKLKARREEEGRKG